jgi:lysophospholipase L1-like esterase
MNDSTTRRELIKTSLAFAATAATWRSSDLLAGDESTSTTNRRVILFQGDSITDVGRDRNRKQANDANALGNGYPMLVACDLLRDHAAGGLKIYNRGISGNKVPDLDKRWDEDCIALAPDILSILIGVNDIWHKLNGKYDGTVESYHDGLSAVIARTKEALPKTQIIICEPFALRCGAVTEMWYPEFDERRVAARRVAEVHGCEFIPFQSLFDDVLSVAEATYWARDGVHPTLAGHSLMAKAWREVAKI